MCSVLRQAVPMQLCEKKCQGQMCHCFCVSTSSAVPALWAAQVAADAAMDLPPLQKDAGLLRMCHLLAELCHFAYASQTADVGTTISIAVPSMGLLSERAAVSAQLVHFR